jgi:hypothetical protein
VGGRQSGSGQCSVYAQKYEGRLGGEKCRKFNVIFSPATGVCVWSFPIYLLAAFDVGSLYNVETMEQVVYVAVERRERRSLTHRARACESKCRFDIGLTGRPLRSHSSFRSRPHPVPHSPHKQFFPHSPVISWFI